DGYCWIGDSPDEPKLSPEYSRHFSSNQDVDFSLNGCQVYFNRGLKVGEIRVDLGTLTPNLARFEKRGGPGEEWKETPANFAWFPREGQDSLEVRSVNAWGKAGPVTHVWFKGGWGK